MILHSQPYIDKRELQAVENVLQSALLSYDTVAEELCLALANYVNKPYVLLTGNGSQALQLLLLSLEPNEQNEVICPTYVCQKVNTTISNSGLVPKLADNGKNWAMDTNSISPHINANSKAIVFAHAHGINAWQSDLNKFNIPVIEDACQCFGATKTAKTAGFYSQMGFSSFHGTKPLVAGEGGFLWVSDLHQYNRILEIRKQNPLYTKCSNVTAAIALSQLNKLTENLERREAIAQTYFNKLPKELTNRFNETTNKTYFRFILSTTKAFEPCRIAYEEKGILVRKSVDNLVHRNLGLSDNAFATAVADFNTTVSIPILPQMTDEQVNYVIETTKLFYNQGLI